MTFKHAIYTGKSLLILSALISTTACGLGTKNPLDKYKGLELYPVDKAQEIRLTNEQIAEENNHVDTDEAGQVVLQNSVFQITTQDNINFIEGVETSFDVNVFFKRGQTKFTLDVPEIPDVSFSKQILNEDINTGKYRLRWTIKKGTLSASQYSQIKSLKLGIKDLQHVSAEALENEAAKKAYDKLQLKVVEIPYIIRKDSNKPTFVVSNLSGIVNSDEERKFTVDVTAPSSYTSTDPLVPEVFYELTNIVNSLGLAESDGAIYVKNDTSGAGHIETLGKNKWRIHYILDLKNNTLPQQLDQNLRVADNQDALYVNFSFQIQSDKVAVSDKQTVHLKINLMK